MVRVEGIYKGKEDNFGFQKGQRYILKLEFSYFQGNPAIKVETHSAVAYYSSVGNLLNNWQIIEDRLFELEANYD